ncbi:MAG TPA: T9SS type A sorting domain-containing protein, partial [Ignavibacteriales bacterium]|nr:T9SS type A sorting domain-containing protein [Ignavibacteriales bacterium]
MNVFSEVATSMAADESLDLKRGTSKLSILQKDIELRFTGVWNELGADSVATIKDGTGSVATLFLMRGTGASLANNPLNPNPGVNEPFTVRIPFEAWDITDNRQINVMVVDRFQNPVQKPYYAWNPNNRMYFYLVETPYSETVIKPADSEADSASWAMAAWSLHYKIGDIVKIKYTNPIRPGKDVFRFSTNASVIEIKDDGIGAPKEYSLSQNYPNPFNPATTINFAVPKAGNVKITVYDMLGREVEILTNKEYSLGVHKIEWNASRYSSGVYFYRLESAGFSLAKKMLLIK